MATKTNKSLWTLISGSIIQSNPEVLDEEIEASKDLISQGISFYTPNDDKSAKEYAAKKVKSENIRSLVTKLSKLLGVAESVCSDILFSYLVTEFRGTMQSLKEFLKEEDNTLPLLLDIWQFYRAERLYLLQIIKHILAGKSDPDCPEYLDKASKLLDSTKLNKLLIKQIESVTKEKKPNTDVLSSSLGKTCSSLWIHFNLREISELLQILLISLSVNGYENDDILTITDAFYQFGFGSKLSLKVDFDEPNSQLVKSISYLCIMNLVYLLDLPTLTSSKEDHKIWNNTETVSKVERLISGLGSSPTHSPALLTWTLSCYLAKGAEGLGKSTRMGEAAVGNRVLKHFENILVSDFMCHPVIADVIHMQVFSVVSVLLTVFDPANMGMQVDISSLALILLKHQPAAEQLWGQEEDTGLRLLVTEHLHNFPLNFVSALDVLISLSSASEVSCCNAVSSIASLNIYTEKVDGINIRIGENVDGTVQLLEERYPYISTKSIYIPAGTRGDLLENGQVRWKLKVNGWQILLAECCELNLELSSGEGQMNSERLARVTRIGNLVAAILKSCPDKSRVLEAIISQLQTVCIKVCQVAQPPVQLVAAILQTLANLAKAEGTERDGGLNSTCLLPHFSMSHSLLVKTTKTLDPGLVGHLLAGEETVSGEYPLLKAFLSYMIQTCKDNSCLPGILLIAREILPGLANWRYQTASDRELILKLCLQTLLAFVNNVKDGSKILANEVGVSSTLLNLVSTGDKTVQTMLEEQVSWEKGRGTDFCEIIQYSLKILQTLLNCPESSALMLDGPVGAALRSPPSGHSHLVQSLAHYTFFFHDPALVTAAVNLLAAIARSAGVADQEQCFSMLACLGNSAVSVKERLVNRLESCLEDIRLKMSIIELVSECVVTQPGIIQLLLDININVQPLQSDESAKQTSDDTTPQLIGEGCLEPALGLLALCKERQGDNWDKLHLALVKLIYRLWDSASLLATRHLKDTPDFWSDLCWPLYSPRDNPEPGHVELKAYILNILASEIYTWKGKVVPELKTVLDKICNEKSDSLKSWCHQNIQISEGKEKTLIDTSSDLEDVEPQDTQLFLLSSWKIFLLVITKDHPVSFSPGACNLTFTVTIEKLMSVLKEEPPPVRLTLLLSETAAALSRRWQTKCTNSMTKLCKDISSILETVCTGWSSIHPRSRVAVLSLTVSTLRCSKFKLEVGEECSLLTTWLPPVVKILALSFRQAETQLATGKDSASPDLQISELVLSLLQSLIARFSHDQSWLGELHREASVQLLLSAVSTCCRHKVAPHFVKKIFCLLQEISSSQSGTAALLTHELSQQIWLPLSDLPSATEWDQVVLLGVELASVLLRTGRTHALKTTITAVALLSDKLVNDHLLKLRSDISCLSSAVTITRLVALLSNYVALWRSDHLASLIIMYRCCCTLLHYSSALLMRPSYLGSLLKVSQGCGTEEDTARCRKVSTASSLPDLDLECVLPPEAVTAHSQLLDICGSCLSLLLSLSPPLSGLLTGDVMLDPGQWEPLLSISFTNPSLEDTQEESSYGTLLALANTCVRAITRDHARSPSPGRAGSLSRPTQLGLDTPEKKQLSTVLEKSIVLVLSQSIFTLSHSGLVSRDKQLLKREIGSELGSMTDTWKRQFCRQFGGKSPAQSRSGRSPAPTLASTPARGKSPQPPASPQPQTDRQRARHQDDQFIRFVANLIGNVYK